MKKSYRLIKAGLRTDKKRKDGKCPIYLFIYSEGLTQKLSLSEYIPESVWDKDKERADAKGYGELNTIIMQKKLAVETFIRESAAQGKEVGRKEISNFWNGRAEREVNFYKFYEDFCTNHFETIKPATQVHYITLGKKLKSFSPGLKFQDIDYAFMEDFKKYLKNTKSGVYNMLKFLKRVLREAKKLKLITDDSWMETRNECPKPKEDFLTTEEVKAIVNVDLSGCSKRVSVSRDFFLFCCYTGLRYSDGQNLKRENYKGNLKFTHVKTGNYQETPLMHEAKKILAKYFVKNNSDGHIFPRIQNQTLNNHLKTITLEAKVNKRISSHYARHSFGAMLLANNVNSFHIAMLMGHKKINQSFTYTHTTPEGLRNVLNNVRENQSPLKNSSKDKS